MGHPLVHYTGTGQSLATVDILKFPFVQDGNYGGVQNSSTALGNLAQKFSPYSRMHVFNMFWSYKHICSHIERAERIECPAFPIIYINFRIFFHWKVLMVSWGCVFVYVCLLCCKITTQLCFPDLQHYLKVVNRNASSVGSTENYKSKARNNSLAFWGLVPVFFITLIHIRLLLRCMFIQAAFCLAIKLWKQSSNTSPHFY